MVSKGPTFFGGAVNALTGGNSGKINGMSIMDIATGKKAKKLSGVKPPVDNSHSHSNNNSSDLPTPSFMGKNESEKFSTFTDTSSVDRKGRVMTPDSLDPVGIKPAMNPPIGVPIPPDIDEQGINSLYS